jgi:serine/threonine protein kinase
VAVKVYKSADGKPDSRKNTIRKFKRQVSTLLELQQPFKEPADPKLWVDELARTRPSELFVMLLDYSRDATGAVGPSADGSMYVITELAEETLKSFVKRHCESSEPLRADCVRKIAREVTLAMAGLHAKGLVHLDMKPENIMLSGGRWKLIDMDGCFRNGAILQQSNGSVSFSPCYCAPEFAKFVTKGGSITITPALDVWSVGLTIAELVELCPLLRASYQQVAKGLSRREGSTRFLKWLSSQRTAPRLTRECDDSFRKLLDAWLLVVNQAKRRTLAESLSSDFYARGSHA